MALGYHFVSSCSFLGYEFGSFVPRPFLIYFLKNRFEKPCQKRDCFSCCPTLS